MTIAMHSSIGHDLPYWPICGDWHGLVEMATKRHRHKQQCKAAERHPISLVDIIKIYSIKILVILMHGSTILLIYIRSGSPTILDAVIVVLWLW